MQYCIFKESRLGPLRRIVLSISLLIIGTSTASAGGPENAVVVVNAESASSKLVANFYIHEREIPPNNVIYLSGIPRGELIKLEDFVNKILKPLLLEIDKRKIGRQIDYVIYSSGFPTKINAHSARVAMKNSNVSKYISLAKNQTLFPELSLTSATYYYHSILTNQFDVYLSLNSNFYYRATTRTLLTRPFTGSDMAKYTKATQLARSKDLETGIELMSELAQEHPLQVATHYWLARMHAQNDDPAAAIESMKQAIAAGWSYRDYAKSDAAFAKLKTNKRFSNLLNSIPNFPFDALASQSFQAQHAWSYNGSVNSNLEQGQRYLLSTMLSVTRNKGINEKQSLRYLGKAIGADHTMPKGTFYFTKTNDVRSKTRLPHFDGAISELKRLGYSAKITTGKMPRNRTDVLGMMIGTPRFDWKASGCRTVPGALCDNLTSFGGWLEKWVGQTKLTQFLIYGSAGSCGTVREPFAIQAKFPHPRLFVHYVRGCTLAESYYQAVHGPFQLLIVGDALCQPYAKVPEIEINGKLSQWSELTGMVEVKIDSSKSPVAVGETQIFLDGRKIITLSDSSAPFRFDTSTLPDGYHEFRFVPVAAGPIATKGRKIIPVIVNNRGRSVELKAVNSTTKVNGTLKLNFDAPGATEVRLLHNSRTLAKSDKDNGQFTIPAFELGRGTVSVGAVATYDGSFVSSKPVELKVEGAPSTRVPVVKSPPNFRTPGTPKPKDEKSGLPKKTSKKS